MIKALVKDDKDLDKDTYWITLPNNTEKLNKKLEELRKQQIYIIKVKGVKD